MIENCPLRVYDSAGEIVAACRELENAIGLVCVAGAGATISLGVSKSQKIYTLTQSDAGAGEWYGGGWYGADSIDIAVKGGAMKDHRGGEKLYHLAPLFSINVRANC